MAGVALAVIFTACGREGNTALALSRAEAALAVDNMEIARATVDSIVDATEEGLEKLEPVALCRMAVIYKKLADCSESEEADLTLALKCYRTAFHQSADSVIAFRRRLKLDDAAAFEVLSMLTVVSDSPVDLDKEEPLDLDSIH